MKTPEQIANDERMEASDRIDEEWDRDVQIDREVRMSLLGAEGYV